MGVASGRREFGPDNASLEIRTYREGVAARVGHDLIIAVRRWDATVDLVDDPAGSHVELNADPRSLEVLEGHRGVKPLTDKDRKEILKNVDQKVLGGQPISFRSSAVRPAADGLAVDGDLTMAGATRPVTIQLDVAPDGQLSGTIPLVQSEWGIKPYRGLMGALKVRDDVEVVISARSPS